VLIAETSTAVRKFLQFKDDLGRELENRRGLENLVLGPETLESYLSRFIVATNGNVEGAVEQILEHQNWVETNHIAERFDWAGRRILEDTCDPEQINKHYPLYIRGRDRYGHRVVYAKAGEIDVKAILRLCEAGTFVSYHSWLRERMMRMRDIELAQCRNEDQPYQPYDAQYTVVIDFNGTSLSQVGPTFYSLMQQTAHIDQIYYPERMFRSIFIHTPFIFTAVWRVIKGFLDKDTVEKLRIVRSGYAKYLFEIIDPSNVPEEYGGQGPPLTPSDHISEVTERFFEEQRQKEREREREAFELERSREKKEEEEGEERKDTIAQVVAQPVTIKTEGLTFQDASSEVAARIVEETIQDASDVALAVNETKVEGLGVENPGTYLLQAEIKTIESDKHAFMMEQALGNSCSSVHDLQVALLGAHLEFEQVERETLEENNYLRRQCEALLEDGQETVATDDVSDFNDPEMNELESQIESLRRELEDVLEETSAHQRAISFAKKFIEEESAKWEDDKPLCKLKEQVRCLKLHNEKLSEALERSFGKGASSLFV